MTQELPEQDLARTLDAFKDGVIRQGTELRDLHAYADGLEEQLSAIKHDFGILSAKNRKLLDENASYRQCAAQDARTIEDLQAKLYAAQIDGAQAIALVNNIRREILDFDQGNDPAARSDMPSPEEMIAAFRDLAGKLRIDPRQLLQKLTPAPEVPQEKPSALSKLASFLGGKQTYLDEMEKAGATRPPMMQSVVDEASATAQRLEGKP